MTGEQIAAVQRTWKLFRHIKPEIIGDVFYSKLFTELPALKKVFKNPMTDQYKKLVGMLNVIVNGLQNPEALALELREMARRHVGYQVRPGHYKLVGDCLLWTLEQGLGYDWNKEVKEAWSACYDIVSRLMIELSAH